MQKGTILVNNCQKGNQLLKYFHNVPWEYSNDIQCDYQVGRNTSLLFLSIKFHQLKPSYITERIDQLIKNNRKYNLQILLCQIDLKDYESLLFELTTLTIQSNFTLLLSWSWEESAKIIENLKSFEYKSSDLLKPRIENDQFVKREEFLRSTRTLNRTDIMILANKFNTLANIVGASEDELIKCQGIGPTKCKKLKSVFTSPFKPPDTN